MTETEIETETDTDERDWRAKVGDALGKAGGMALFIPAGIAGRAVHATLKHGTQTLEPILPFIGRTYQKLGVWSIERMHAQSSGDAVAARLGEDLSLSFEPAKLKDAEVDDDGAEQSGWHLKSTDRVWDETMGGRDIARLGKAPLIFLPDDSTRRVSPVEARVRSAIERGDWQHVFRVERDSAIQMDTTLYAADPGGNDPQAVADGGGEIVDYDAVPARVRHAILEDTLVDISDPGRVSMSKLSDMYREDGDADRMDEVGRLNYEAGRLDAEDTDVIGKVVKLLLAIAAILAVIVVGPKIFGATGGAVSGGGGGGGLIPILIGLGVI